MAYERERDVAVKAAQEAAAVIRQRAGQIREEAVRAKGINDLVTATDEEAQRLITRALRAAFPDYAVLAEEGTDPDQLTAAADGHRWIVDPIDGTMNFVHGVPPYAVSIGLQRDDEVVVGVVLEVKSGELFTAVRGEGTYVDGEPARVSTTAALEKGLLATGFPYRAFDHLDAYLDVLGRFMHTARGLRRHGSAAIDLAYVACGRFDGFFETGLKPWDVAAGTLLVEEAGGQVTDYHDQPHPVFARQILATNGVVHEPMLEIVQRMEEVRS